MISETIHGTLNCASGAIARRTRVVVLILLAVQPAACTGRLPAAPPVGLVSVGVFDLEFTPPTDAESGSGVVLGDRLLTSLHVALDERGVRLLASSGRNGADPQPKLRLDACDEGNLRISSLTAERPARFFVNGEATRVARVAASGDLGRHLGEGDREGSSQLDRRVRDSVRRLAADWIALELAGELGPAEPQWTIGPPARPGEIVFAFRGAPGASSRVEVSRLMVRDVWNERTGAIALPDGVRVATPKDEVIGPGWSGCFVGRFDRQDGRWELLGIVKGQLSASESLSDVPVVIVRPPEPVLRWLVTGAAPGGAESMVDTSD